jgi:hypothetical protein
MIPAFTALAVFVIQAAVAVFLFFAMILALNGVSSRTAESGLLVYVVGAAAVGLATTAGTFFLARFLLSREWRPVGTVFLSGGLFLLTGMFLELVFMFAGIIVADAAHRGH